LIILLFQIVPKLSLSKPFLSKEKGIPQHQTHKNNSLSYVIKYTLSLCDKALFHSVL